MWELLELVFEPLLEGFLELVVYCYIKLMTLIVPDKVFTEKTKKRIKNVVTTISAMLGIVLIIGLILLIQEDFDIKNIGRYMTAVPLLIIGVQIALGIVVKVVNKFRTRG